MSKAGIVAGIVLAIVGVGLIIGVNFFSFIPDDVYINIWGAIILAIGAYMIINYEKEKQIEQVKPRRRAM